MKRTLFIFTLLFSPVFIKAGDPEVAVQPPKDTLPAQTEIANKEEDSTEFWKGAGIGASVALLVMGIGVYFFWKKEKRKLKEKFDTTLNNIQISYRQIRSEGNASAIDSENNIREQIKISERKISTEPETEINSESTVAISVPPPVSPPPIVPKKIYAGMPSGRLLYRVSDNFEPQSTYFVIEINPDDPNTGKLSLVNEEATRLNAFSMADALRDACDLQNTPPVINFAQVQETPGAVYLEAGYWTINKKITLKW